MQNSEKTINITLTETQVKTIYKALKQYTDIILDDPIIVGVDDDEFESDEESDAVIIEYINKNINSIINEMNKQIKNEQII